MTSAIRITIALGSLAITYGIFALIALDSDPGGWSGPWRWLFVIAGAACVGACLISEGEG